jgi:hypothetical protein
VLAGITGGLVASGCHKDPTSSQKPVVINQLDNFHLQFTDIKDLDTTLVYYWQMEGTSANIDQSTTIQGGQASVTVEDSNRVAVYYTDLKDNVSFVTQSGLRGSWRIRFTLTGFSGIIDFRARRR